MNKNTLKRIALAEKIVELRKLGYTNHQIIEQLNTSYMTVYNALKNEGLKPLRKNQVERTDRIDRIEELKNKGLSNVEIGEMMKIHPGTVSRLGSNLKAISEKKIRQEKIDKILELKSKGFSRKEVANMMNYEYKFVWRNWNK